MARILIAESHAQVRLLLERMVTRLGHEPITAKMPGPNDLGEAQVILVEPVDPLGAVLAQAASIAHPSLPLICASVTAPPPELAQLGVRFAVCLVKPFTIQQLDSAIREALLASRAHGGDQHPDGPQRKPQNHSPTDSAFVDVVKRSTVKRRLLLVDDEQHARTISHKSLERAGAWTVVSVASGEEALDVVVSDGPFDAIVLDVAMPGMSGPSTLEGLRDYGLSDAVPVIFLAAKANATERQGLEYLGSVGVISKPIDSLAFPSEVEQLLSP